jgi:hypothetical protein
MTNTLHAHVSLSQRDCDGPTYDSYVEVFNDDEVAEFNAAQVRGYNDFSDLHFKGRVLSGQVAFHAEEATVDIHSEGFNYHERTDEGYRASSVLWCESADCDLGEKSHRDVYAEQMNY